MIDIVGKRKLFFIISGVVIMVGVVFLTIFGLPLGIEFGSGSMMRVDFEQEVKQAELKEHLASLGYGDAIVQHTVGGDYYIRTGSLGKEEKAGLKGALEARFGSMDESEFYSVSPMIAVETARNAGIAVAVAALGILLYVSWAFHRMPNPFRYGTCALIALGHDLLVVLGTFAILGSVFGWEINLMFITGVLAVIGYSVNNTVVIFDRIRENLVRRVSTSFKVVANNSLIETFSRSINTSLTTLVVVLALFLFVGSSIQNFAVVLIIGIIAGTYSSICIAPQILVAWERE